uniref:ceramide glucosyltransferase n=1 Tax=Opuntia streptacantha TaxID=393608 RepID=A0A7C9E5I4_OPUST
MSTLESLDSFLLGASRACLSPIAVFIQIQGCVICLVLALGWAFAAYVRNREIKRMEEEMRHGNSFAFLCHDINELEHSNQLKLPRVTVVMPLKGFGEHNLHNWRTQITSLYGGPIEFLFVVESTEDPAYHAVSSLIKDFQDDIDAKIVVAGYSTTCSQKIHNQLVGAENMHKDSKYILFLDDDIRLHPGTIGALTAEMEKNPEIFIQTGYPLDLPSGSLGSYCIYEFHMPCSMGFATGGKTFFLWGGCMMMHADDFRRDNYGVVSDLRDGGYSDDMTLAAIAGTNACHMIQELTRNSSHLLQLLSSLILLLVILVSQGLLLVGCLAICTTIELLSMWNLTRIEVHLCNLLSPEVPPLSLASYNWCLVFWAMVVDNLLYPISALHSHFSQSINWSGIRYYLRDGRIYKIDRGKDIGPIYTDLSRKQVYGKRGSPPKTSFISSLARIVDQWRQPKKYDV